MTATDPKTGADLAPKPTQAGAALLAEAMQLDAEDAPLPPPELDAAGNIKPPAAPIDYHREARMMLDTAAAVAGPFVPCIPRIWTDDKRAAVAAALGPVLKKYGFTLGDFMGQWQAEVTLAMVAGPLVLETVRAIRAERAAPAVPSVPAAPAAAPVLDPAALS